MKLNNWPKSIETEKCFNLWERLKAIMKHISRDFGQQVRGVKDKLGRRKILQIILRGRAPECHQTLLILPDTTPQLQAFKEKRSSRQK